ncbi:hypothetical protein [Kordiimonas pumila]|uniref:Uncharacterized protein n=1 Tax=Kordiimonas pumila TaxID=2161677 RepID=A0ABV7D2A7_9PROT|nr:hypothetical protein [Kordiimonas pumila]
MQKGWVKLPFLLLHLVIWGTASVQSSDQIKWTEEKVGYYAVKADQAASQKHWSKAIEYGEHMLRGSSFLYKEDDIEYLNRLKTLNRYYDKAGKLGEVADRVQKAYELSYATLGPRHHISELSRLLYYKLLIAEKNYRTAIPLVQENIKNLSLSKDDAFQRLHYLEQLFSLYGLTGQLEEEAQTILRFLALDRQLVASPLEENLPIIITLAKNYCQRKKIALFQELMQTYGLEYECETK